MNTRSLRRIALSLWLAVLLSALSVVHAKYEARKLFSGLQALHRERDALEIEWGRLTIEQGTWATHGRIEKLAAEELDLRIPATDEVVIVRQ